jgi:transcriptional regulator with XRE-family HTH domain
MVQLTVTQKSADETTLRARRQAAGLSQETLAHRAQCSVAMVKLLESGYQPDRSEVLPRVLEVLSTA